jgi:Nif-specific regulatory protein
MQVRPIAALPGGPAAPVTGDGTLRLLCDLQRRIGAAPGLGQVLTEIADAVLIMAPRATHATVVLRDETAGETAEGFVPVLTRVRGASGVGAAPRDAVRVTRSVFRKVVRERAAVLAANAPEGELSTESLLGASIQSTIGVPLWKGEEIVGVLQVDNRAAPAMFTAADVDAVAVLAANASLAVANARLIDRLRLIEEQLRSPRSQTRGCPC